MCSELLQRPITHLEFNSLPITTLDDQPLQNHCCVQKENRILVGFTNTQVGLKLMGFFVQHPFIYRSLVKWHISSVIIIMMYARNTPGSICQYKEDGLVSRPPSLFTSMRRPMHGTSCPKSQLKSTCLTAKFGSFLDHAAGNWRKRANVISSSVQHPISLIFAIHVSLIIPLPMMWILLTKPMQKSVTIVCFIAVSLDWKINI